MRTSRPTAFLLSFLLGVQIGGQLVQGIGEHFHDPVRSGVGRLGNAHHAHIAILDDQEAQGGNLHAAADTAAEGVLAAGFIGKITAAATKANALDSLLS